MMIDPQQILGYLNPAHQSFWTWADIDQSVAWESGGTIAFRGEIAAVVRRLAPGGLPPLAAIVLLLAATRDGWATAHSRFVTHCQQTSSGTIGDSRSAAGITLRAIGHRLESDVAALIQRLNAIATLPANLRHPLTAKAELAAMAFESTERIIAPQLAAQIAQHLESQSQIDNILTPVNAVRELVDTIDAFRNGLAKMDAEQVSLRLRTGLDELVKPADDDLGPSEKVRQLLNDLNDDPALGGVARLAKNLLAAVQVPRTLHRQQELPIGGVADMSNRGSLDRLLVSELANDDLTLAVRVAMNEALYLQRESPPRQPPHGRTLVIDAGIRIWGVPRVFAAAVAMALSATGDRDAELQSYRPEIDALLPVDLTTRDGLLAHLEALDASPHFGDALAKLPNKSDGQPAEVFLITHEDVLEDPAFRAALAKLDGFHGYLAGVNRQGRFQLWSISPAGRKLVRQATLNLDSLLEPPKRPASNTRLLETESDLPVILSVEPFPLSIPTNAKPRACVHDHLNGLIEFTNDRRLVHWHQPNQSPRQLIAKVPRGKLDLLAVTPNGFLIAVFSERRPNNAGFSHRRVVVDLCTFEAAEHQFITSGAPYTAFAIHEELIYLIRRNEVLVFEKTFQPALASIPLDGRHWIRGRIFHTRRDCCVLAYDGTALKFETYEVDRIYQQLLFEGPAFEGLQLWDGSGVLNLVGGHRCKGFGTSITDSRPLLSPDGRRIFVEEKGSAAGWEFTSNTNAWVKKSYVVNARTLATGSDLRTADRTTYIRSLRTRLIGIAVDHDGRLVMFTGKRRAMLTLDFERLVFSTYSTDPSPAMVPFLPLKESPRLGFNLQVATWPDGSRAYMDSRGMLHLKSSDRKVNQITLVLCDDHVAGWSSADQCFGSDYFHGDKNAGTGEDLAVWICRFTERLR